MKHPYKAGCAQPGSGRPTLPPFFLITRSWLLLLACLLSLGAYAAPGNDLCTNATTITASATCTPLAGTLFEASGSGPAPSVGQADDDVWYKFVATSKQHTITLDATGGTDLVQQLFSGTCGGLVSIKSSDPEIMVVSGLTIGATYYLRVYSYFGNPQTVASGAFTICLNNPGPAPANDECTSAISLTPSKTCTGTVGTVAGATPSDPDSFTGEANDDVWYSFVATSVQHIITVDPTGGTDMVHQLFRGNCGTLTSLFSSDNEVLTATNLTPGETYYLRVYSYFNAQYSGNAAKFTVCIDRPDSPPVNDNCANAISLTPGLTCQPISGTLFSATQTTLPNDGACGNPDDDVWYKFVAAASAQGISVTPNSAVDIALELRSGACPGTKLRCKDQGGAGSTDSISAQHLTPGATYYVRVYSYAASPTTATTGAFTICVTTPKVCDAPTALTATNINSTAATLGFTASAGGASYKIEYGPKGFTPGAGTVKNISSSPTTITGLTASTQYDFYVTQTCSNGLTSVRVGPKSFTTSAPVCEVPTNLNTSGITAFDATLNWSAGAGTVASYRVEYGKQGFTQGTGTVLTVIGATTKQLTGLTPNTSYQFYVRQNCGTGVDSPVAGPVTFKTLELGDLIVDKQMNVQGNYNNVTVTGTGVAILTGPLTAAQNMTVQQGGILRTGAFLATANKFTLADGATLEIGAAEGISANGATGSVRGTTLTFSPFANYVYNGSAAQVTGAGLPQQVRSLQVTGAAPLTLTRELTVLQVLSLKQNLVTNGKTLLLRSTAGGSALVHNNGGTVVGNAVVQHFLPPTPNGLFTDYLLSTPVQSTTLVDLTTPGFTPVVNPAYNTASDPSKVTPYPNIFSYDQSRVGSTNDWAADFQKGWKSPAATSENMVTGKGYLATAGTAASNVDFVGSLLNGTVNVFLLDRGTPPQAGWHLVGNPYASPVDWTKVYSTATGLDAAVYQLKHNGAYSASVNGIGGSPIIGSGEGFLTHVSTAGTQGKFSFTNSARVTTFTPHTYTPPTNETRPLLQLGLSRNGIGDTLFVYFQQGASAAFDPTFDAYKVPVKNAPQLASAVGTSLLAIDGRPALGTADVEIPLAINAPAAGSYLFRAAYLLNVPATTFVYLRDAQTGKNINLKQLPTYSFSVSAAGLNQSRFTLLFTRSAITTTLPEKLRAQVALYPNPAHHLLKMQIGRELGRKGVQLQLYNALGQQVAQRSLPAGATGEQQLSLQGLARGVYMLRLTVADGTMTQRIVVE
ncbi:fibronectin type III domain-containing protein [Hymenobacter sp. BT730]|uniref:fibronectin type III domain-containing protein n=1 Tax=Hymenobacter sp. BT730 TaxID=3063332 RepID=UPI0026E068BD|nr:fibronectin type III domain-containing protein [Hymenobacter sp. BT730]